MKTSNNLHDMKEQKNFAYRPTTAVNPSFTRYTDKGLVINMQIVNEIRLSNDLVIWIIN